MDKYVPNADDFDYLCLFLNLKEYFKVPRSSIQKQRCKEFHEAIVGRVLILRPGFTLFAHLLCIFGLVLLQSEFILILRHLIELQKLDIQSRKLTVRLLKVSLTGESSAALQL